MVDSPEVIKARIRDSIANITPYFLPIENINSEIELEDFIQKVLAEPGEVLEWFDEKFSLRQGLEDLIRSLDSNIFDLRITSFTCFKQGNLQLSFNASSETQIDQGFLQAVGIDTSGLRLGDLIELQSLGLSLSYEPESKST
jgi:hypothetical protein